MDPMTAAALEKEIERAREIDKWAHEILRDSVVCARESLESGDWEEKLNLFNEHARELRRMESALALDVYRRLEAKGRLVLVTARLQKTEYGPLPQRDQELVGYSSHIWFDDLHFSLRTADDDAWFVARPFRRCGIGRKLREKAHEVLRELGVKFVLCRLKVSAPHDEVLDQLGYTPWENTFRKEL
jgi:GNAT superfamily N-acetyltransferase